MNDKGKKHFVRKEYRIMRMDNCLKKKISMLYRIILHVLCIMTDKDSCAIWETNRCIHV